MTYTIYGVSENGGVVRYVGRTKLSAERRLRKHLRNAEDQRMTKISIWLRTKPKNVSVRVLAQFDDIEEATAAEAEWVVKLGTHLHGYNSTPTGGPLGYKHTDASREMMRENAHTPAKLRQRSELHQYNRERDYGEDFGKTVSKALKGLQKTEQHREALSKALTGRKLPEKHNEAFQRGARAAREKDPERFREIARRTTNIRSRCNECGYEAVVQTVGRHQKKTGHVGRTRVELVDE